MKRNVDQICGFARKRPEINCIRSLQKSTPDAPKSVETVSFVVKSNKTLTKSAVLLENARK
jgi:hypothetical protein